MPEQTTIERVTGSYERQLPGYSAFVPLPLPPDPPVNLDGELQTLLSNADRALARLDAAVATLPNPDLFVMMYARKEAVVSSRIEGTRSSIHDLIAAEANVFTSSNREDASEVLNHQLAMRHGLELLETLPVSVRLIREVHEVLLSGVRGDRLEPGVIRTRQNRIDGIDFQTAEFVPPPPAEVPDAMAAWERFVNLERPDMPELIRIGLAHAQFETIHPFLDGNGRVGRLLITLLLCAREILVRPALYLSSYFNRHRSEYYDRLQATRDEGDWEGWLAFILRGVAIVSNDAARISQDILALKEHHQMHIALEMGKVGAEAYRLLQQLFAFPFVSVKEVENDLGLTYSSANRLVSRFVDAGILTEYTQQQRNRRFIYADYVALFGDEDDLDEDPDGEHREPE